MTSVISQPSPLFADVNRELESASTIFGGESVTHLALLAGRRILGGEACI